MTEQQLRVVYPLIAGWIRQTLAEHAAAARPVASLGFSRLPHYYEESYLPWCQESRWKGQTPCWEVNERDSDLQRNGRTQSTCQTPGQRQESRGSGFLGIAAELC